MDIGYALTENLLRQFVNLMTIFKPLYKKGEEYMAVTMKNWNEAHVDLDKLTDIANNHTSDLAWVVSTKILPVIKTGKEEKFFLVPYKCFAIKISRDKWLELLYRASKCMN